MTRTEEILLEEALDQTGSNQVQAACLLGMQRSSFRKKLRRHDDGKDATSCPPSGHGVATAHSGVPVAASDGAVNHKDLRARMPTPDSGLRFAAPG